MARACRMGSLSLAKPDIHPRLLEGEKFLKWSDQDGNVATPVTVSIDQNGNFIYWHDQNKDITFLDIVQIVDIRTGAQAKTPKDVKLREMVSMGSGTLEDKTMTVVHGVDFVNVNFTNFCTNKVEAAQLWCQEVWQLVRNANPLLSNAMSNLRKIHTQINLNAKSGGKIPVKAITKIFAQSKEDRKIVERALDMSGLPSGKNDEINPLKFGFEEFLVFYKRLVQRSELSQIFKDVCGQPKKHLECKEFLNLLNNTQRDPRLNEILHPYATEEKARLLIQRYEPNKHLVTKDQLSDEGLLRFLLSEDNLIVAPKRDEDMDAPLPHYFINSSHNTYLTGHQLTGRSSVEMYRQALLAGCRCVELDFWNGRREEEPTILHGYTLVPEIPAKDVIQAIAEAAFKTSDYPLILSFENHCNPKNQAKIAQYCKDYFGDAMLTEPLDSHPLEKGVTLPSPELLKGKILIKNKKKHLHGHSKSQSSPLPAPDMPAPVLVPQANGDLPSNVFVPPGEEDDSEDSDSDEEEDEHDEVKTVKAVHIPPDTDSGTAGKESKAGAEISALVNYIQPVHFKGFDHASRRKRSNEMSSLVETNAYAYLKESPVEFVDYNKFQLSRIYPKGTRVDSSNYMPQAFWNTGCQLVALNYQTLDVPMQLNLGIFQLTGKSGYLLKPDFMCREDRKFDPFTESSLDNIVSATVMVQVLSGQFLTDRHVGTYVEVEMYGLPCDTVWRRNKFRTKTIPNNGIAPIYSEDAFVFRQVVLPDLAVLRIAAYEESGKLVGHRVLPVVGLCPGYRHLPLFNEVGQPLHLPCLFLKITVKDYVPNNLNELADALANPIKYQSELDKRDQQLAILRDDTDDEEGPEEAPDRHVSPEITSPAKSPLDIVRQGSVKPGGQYNKGGTKDGSPTISQRTDSNKSLPTKPEEVASTLDNMVITPESVNKILESKSIKQIQSELSAKLESLTKKYHKESTKLDASKTTAEDKLTRNPSRPKNPLHKASMKIAKKISATNLGAMAATTTTQNPEEVEAKREDLHRAHYEKKFQIEKNYRMSEKELQDKYLESKWQAAEKLMIKSQSSQMKTLENLHNQEAEQVMKRIEAETKAEDVEPSLNQQTMSKEDIARERRNRLVKRGVAERGRLQEVYSGRKKELENQHQLLRTELKERWEKAREDLAKEHSQKMHNIEDRNLEMLRHASMSGNCTS